VGYLIAALIAGFFVLLLDKVSKNHKILPWIVVFLGSVLAFASIFILGLYQFAKVGEVSLSKAFVASVLPYLPGTVIKILVIIPLAKRFRPIIRNYLY
jgi:biotin transport system substrate-specific component